MRIQHNIMAMNAYRNYTSNTSALSKNLEKLSSGYKINRAGDDAAGLAISEKMRAQVTGLKAAQKNAKDGISLVQTAEGALTEVHSMLNRMVDLADQSANGTYDNETDRANLQKEFDALRTEIDRIADSTNFNGIKLLDGSLSTKGSSNAAISGGFEDIRGALAAGVTDIKAVKAKNTVVGGVLNASATAKDGDIFTMTLGMSDGTQKEFSVTAKVDSDNKTTFYDQDGNELTVTIARSSTATAGKITTDLVNKAMKEAIAGSDFGKSYNITTGATGTGKLTLEAKAGGTGTAHITSIGFTAKHADDTVIALKATAGTKTQITATTKGADATESLDLSKAVVYDGTNLSKATFEINGEKFVFVENGKVDDKALAAMKEAGITHYVELDAVGSTATDADVTNMIDKIKMATGLDVKQGSNTSGAFTVASTGTHIKLGNGTSSKKNGGLTLQIGDTSESFNQLTVSVSDMHAKALGLADLSIAEQDTAKAAVETIKEGINSVSATRGDLGALQNRLEHTRNNLSVMTENIQDAEANIRDVDVAEEMMAYTKNNILVQSAQAMLAQANQLPQGVLQLLQ